MEKKKYVKPEIREEYQILTVSAWVTKTQYVVTTPTTTTTVSLQTAAQAVSSTNYQTLDTVTSTAYGLQQAITKTSVGLQESLVRRAG